MMQWLSIHPNFLNNPVFLGSDSYAGIITPILAQDIINGNLHLKFQHPNAINFASLKPSL